MPYPNVAMIRPIEDRLKIIEFVQSVGINVYEEGGIVSMGRTNEDWVKCWSVWLWNSSCGCTDRVCVLCVLRLTDAGSWGCGFSFPGGSANDVCFVDNFGSASYAGGEDW